MKDKNGIAFEEFDVLKVFHFIGARNKKHYMYKMVLFVDGKPYGAHLNKNPLARDYPLWLEDRHDDTEIVQSQNWKKLR